MTFSDDFGGVDDLAVSENFKELSGSEKASSILIDGMPKNPDGLKEA